MAKCPICGTRKGKRKCTVVDNSFVCSLCCGTSRNEAQCTDCSYYQTPSRKYNAAPSFSTIEMRDDYELQHCSNTIEGALATFNAKQQDILTDDDAIGIYELLMDKYHFNDSPINSDNALWQQGFNHIDKEIQKEMKRVDKVTTSKVLGATRASARRRTSYTHKEYMNFIATYVGQSGSGLGVIHRFFS